MPSMSTIDLHRIFDKLDEDKNGLVSLKELTNFLENIGFQTRKEDLEKLLGGKQCLDPIDFCFFHDAIVKEMGTKNNVMEKDLIEAFGVFDSNDDGFISCEELQSALYKMGLWDQQCGKDCKRMIQEFDSNFDGMLDFEEFKNMMLS